MLVALPRCTLGGIFIVAAILKLVSMNHAPDDLLRSVIGASTLARVAVCVFELLIGVWLITGVAPTLSSIATIVICSSFLGILVAEVQKSVPKPCGCFGTVVGARSPEQVRAGLMRSIGLNVAMMLAAGILLGGSGTARENLDTTPASPIAATSKLGDAGVAAT